MKNYIYLALLLAASLTAQSFRGSVKGTVEDPSGAALTGAKVTATNTDTGVTRSTLAGPAGDYSVPDLPPGKYAVLALKEGFSEQKSEVEIEVSRTATVNFRLPLASQTSSVAVSAAVGIGRNLLHHPHRRRRHQDRGRPPHEWPRLPPDDQTRPRRLRRHHLHQRQPHPRQQLHDRRRRQ